MSQTRMAFRTQLEYILNRGNKLRRICYFLYISVIESTRCIIRSISNDVFVPSGYSGDLNYSYTL